MESIILITGKVNFSITLDPGVWIFDDRRIDLNNYFTTEKNSIDETEEYTKSISKHWDREIMEGAVFPPTLKTEKKFEKEKVLNGSFGVPFKPFLKNASPKQSATALIIERESKEDVTISLEEAYQLILGFSKEGKPLLENGPIHVYYGNGSNKENPITHVKGFRII
ncbi:peptidyl-prolyl cis-trans isomerase [Bacillus aquiflavi]|uniref:Peptidyl-prolyl cis-trans isomerase n=1 Tax=Bacillus aquiflavi TaxID=2672567 RepID=A0A6B3W3W4_9BACI|nr:peptidyl-prolyl cis-trans isomerase [Bacillus aquiflavi]MBA4537928.1 peptidyl-prolyl cis-trans isomerase [Bacillus aquiflavi]NEY82184.1 peptidyl-prolyl cis-trans isomerase [Bacillus aquiflavi]